MPVFRLLYRIGPYVPDLKEIVVTAADNLAAIDKAREHLAQRYPHFRFVGIQRAADPASLLNTTR